MRIDDVIWLSDVVEKIESKHGINTWEVEQGLVRNSEFRRGAKGYRRGEDVFYASGQTASGRYLFVVFIRKSGTKAPLLRLAT